MSPSEAVLTTIGPAASKMSASMLPPSVPMWSTTNTAAGKPAGRSAKMRFSASNAPAEPPITMISRLLISTPLPELTQLRREAFTSRRSRSPLPERTILGAAILTGKTEGLTDRNAAHSVLDDANLLSGSVMVDAFFQLGQELRERALRVFAVAAEHLDSPASEHRLLHGISHRHKNKRRWPIPLIAGPVPSQPEPV